jgi:hypothetical protein
MVATWFKGQISMTFQDSKMSIFNGTQTDKNFLLKSSETKKTNKNILGQLDTLII